MARLPKQPKPEFNLESILNNPVDAKKLKGFIDESLIFKGKIRTANDDLKGIREGVKDDLGVPPALFNHLVKTKFNESLQQEHEKLEATDATLSKLYGTISGVSGGPSQDEDSAKWTEAEYIELDITLEGQ